MNEGYYFAEVQPAYERVFIGHDKVTRMQDRYGQFLEFTGQELQLIVNYAVENRDVIINNPETSLRLSRKRPTIARNIISEQKRSQKSPSATVVF